MTGAVEAIFRCYQPDTELLILLQGGKAFEGSFFGLHSAGYVVLQENSGARKRDVLIPISAIVAVTRPW